MTTPQLPGTDLAGIVRRRREEIGMSMRESAGLIGISPSYLLAIEHGRNPSTGRAPVPSARILSRIAHVFGLDPAMLLVAAGAPASSSTHLLLYQTGGGYESPADAARSLFAGQVDVWVELTDPRASGKDASRQDDVLLRKRQALTTAESEPSVFEADRVLEALAEDVADIQVASPRRLGVIFGASSAVLRSVGNPQALLDSETTWEHDVENVFRAALGDEPAACICVYRETDIQELALRLDPLAAALSLIRSHPLVAVQNRNGTLATGPAAIETILADTRPAGVGSDTWIALTRAAATGLARQSDLDQSRSA